MFKNISTIFKKNLKIMFKIIQENVKNVYKYFKNILNFFKIFQNNL